MVNLMLARESTIMPFTPTHFCYMLDIASLVRQFSFKLDWTTGSDIKPNERPDINLQSGLKWSHVPAIKTSIDSRTVQVYDVPSNWNLETRRHPARHWWLRHVHTCSLLLRQTRVSCCLTVERDAEFPKERTSSLNPIPNYCTYVSTTIRL